MATPTQYPLNYDSPCDVEAGCGDIPCGGKPEYNPRPQIFCKDAEMLQNLVVNGNTFIRPAVVYVGGQAYVPTLIVANNGNFIALARRADSRPR